MQQARKPEGGQGGHQSKAKHHHAGGAKPKSEHDSVPPISYFRLYRYATWLDLFWIVIAAIASAVSGASMPCFALIMGNMINSFSPTNTMDDMVRMAGDNALLFLYLGIGSFALSYISYSIFMILGERQANRYRRAYFRAILRQDIAYFDEVNPNELTTRIASETQSIQDALSEKNMTIINTIAQIVVGFLIGFIKGWQLTLVLIATFPFLTLSTMLMGWALRATAIRQKSTYEKAGAIAEQALIAIRTVLGLNGEKKEKRHYDSALMLAVKQNRVFNVVASVSLGLLMLLFYLDYALGFWYGSILINDRTYNATTGTTYNVGDVLTIFYAVVMGSMSVGALPPCIQAFAEGKIAGGKIIQVIDRQPKINIEDKNGIKKDSLQGEIVFDNVRFSYPSRLDREILRGPSFRIPAGKKVAFVGESGCGKSTIMQLAERFYDVTSGSLAIDGVNIKDYNLKWLRDQIGYVGQEPVLFNTTIKENMLIARETATDNEIIDALKKAKAYNFVMEHAEGINTVVGTSGSKLSGGQKQRLAIARAILKNPSILLLDEATSALDRTNEAAIQKTLEEVAQGRTSIVIAHRLSTVRDSDIIFAVDAGEIVEYGTHEELMAKKGRYFGLVEAQEKIQQELAAKEAELAQQNAGKVIHMGDKSAGVHHVDVKLYEEAKPQSKDNTSQEEQQKLIQQETKSKDDIKRLFTFSKSERPYLVLGIIFSALDGAVFPVGAILLADMLDIMIRYQEPTFRDDANWVSLWYIILGAICLAVKAIKFWAFRVVSDGVTMQIRSSLFSKMMRMHIGWFDEDKHQPGSLSNMLASDAQTVNTLAGSVIGVILESIASLVTGVIISFTASWKLALISLAFFPLTLFVGRLKIKAMQGFSEVSDEAYKESGGLMSEAITNMRTVASFSNEKKILTIYDGMLRDVEVQTVKKGVSAGFMFGAVQFITFGQLAVTFYCGALFMRADGLPFKSMFLAIFSLMYAAMAAGRATHFLPDVGAAKNAARRIFELIDQPSLIDPETSVGRVDRQLTGEIRFENVAFKYPSREKQILKGVSFTVKPGQKIALVGPSGCGKSTIIQMLQRFYDPTQGNIYIDGVDIKEYDLRSLRQQIGIVSQEPVLFNGTIEYNIKYANEQGTEAEMIEAAKQANAYDFIMKSEFNEPDPATKANPEMGNGFQRKVGPKGSQISGGQKQRVAIARAIMKKPKIYLFDEATSALDNVSEQIVQESLNRLMVNHTSITIAHRLSTIRDVDEILVLNEGEIIERGTYNELLDKHGVFYKMERGILNQ